MDSLRSIYSHKVDRISDYIGFWGDIKEKALDRANEEHVIAARGYLAKKESKKADEALKAAEDGVQFISVSAYSPLLGAKKSLWQATRQYTAGKLDEAAASLRKSMGYLEEAAKSGDAKIRAEAKKLVKGIAALEDKVEKGGEETGSHIKNLWDKVKALSERSVEGVATGWQKLRAESKAKTDLIDAKLHIAYAKIDQSTTGAIEQAKAEIEAAESYIKKAAQHADHATRTRLAEIDKELKEADVGIAVSGATDPARAAADLVFTAPGLSVIIFSP